jgi:DNA-binding transcriptional MocR family regulator
VTPKVSQSTLAAMVGVSRENVNRALATLMAAGVIRQESGRYVLLQEARLREELARDWPLAARRDQRRPPPARADGGVPKDHPAPVSLRHSASSVPPPRFP